jgi:heptosyltransferase III
MAGGLRGLDPPECEAMIRECRQPNCQPVHRGVIISPAALGDNILMLSLAHYMKNALALDQIEFIGHAESVDWWPGRSCVDRVRGIEEVAFHRLFAPPQDFELADRDPLITVLAGYDWIVSFLGAGHADFESNLLFTVNCSHAAEVAVLPLKPDETAAGHVSRFYIEAFCREMPVLEGGGVQVASGDLDLTRTLLWPRPDDTRAGHLLLERHGIEPMRPLAVIHPGSGGAAKVWPAENFCALADRLASDGMQVVFLLGPVERERLGDAEREGFSRAGVCIDGLDLSQVVQILTCVDLYCGNDSGVTHVAAAMGCPTLAVFGPSDPVLYRPCGPRVEVVSERPDRFGQVCEAGVEKVVEAASRLLAPA